MREALLVVVPPHPGPLPWGEGTYGVLPLPWGEETLVFSLSLGRGLGGKRDAGVLPLPGERVGVRGKYF